MQNSKKFILFFMCILSFTNCIQAKNKNILTKDFEQKIRKEARPHRFMIHTYADLQTSHINRPDRAEKKGLFTPAQYTKPEHYNAPNMNQWATDNPFVRKCNVGTLTLDKISYPITSSVRFYKDPFRKPLPGPR